MKYGVEDYLLKPVNETELNQILKKVCSEHHQMLKEKEETNADFCEVKDPMSKTGGTRISAVEGDVQVSAFGCPINQLLG